MDIGTLMDNLKKYRWGIVVLALGLLLMAIPGQQEEKAAVEPQPPAAQESLQESLSQLLSRLEGAGKVQVLLTESVGTETVYQTDDGLSDDSRKKDTVLITGADRAQTGLVRQINPPQYLGAVVLSQGADSAKVRLSIVEAVKSATGLGSDRITVLKMK